MITLLIETATFHNRNGGTFASVITYRLAEAITEAPTHFWLPDGSNTIEPIEMLAEYVEVNTYVRKKHLLMPYDTSDGEPEQGIVIDKAAMIALITQTW